MVGLRVVDVVAGADIGAVLARTGALIVVAGAGIGIVDLPVPGGPQRTGRHSIARMAPWTAGPEDIVILAAASGTTVIATVMATVALALVLMPTVMDSVVVIAVIVVTITLSALHLGSDSPMGAFA